MTGRSPGPNTLSRNVIDRLFPAAGPASCGRDPAAPFDTLGPVAAVAQAMKINVKSHSSRTGCSHRASPWPSACFFGLRAQAVGGRNSLHPMATTRDFATQRTRQRRLRARRRPRLEAACSETGHRLSCDDECGSRGGRSPEPARCARTARSSESRSRPRSTSKDSKVRRP